MADQPKDVPWAVDELWAEIFALVPSPGNAAALEGMRASASDGGAAQGPEGVGEADGGEAGAVADGGRESEAGITAPVEESLPPPRYPEEARRRGEQGEVCLRVLVGTNGRVAEVKLVASSGRERLDAAAREAARRWRFKPATRGGEPIRAWVEIPVEFRLDDPT